MADARIGRQTPTKSVAVPYEQTRGAEAVELYNIHPKRNIRGGVYRRVKRISETTRDWV